MNSPDFMGLKPIYIPYVRGEQGDILNE